MAVRVETNLTGEWRGLYTYPEAGLHVSFVADLVEIAGQVNGEVLEPDILSAAPKTLQASLSGKRESASVGFDKSYRGAPGYEAVVRYQGSVSADGLEIEGTWAIAPDAAGTFLMIRATAEHAPERRIAYERA